ncbi:DUF2059 domain-containing protein [Flavobacterium sp. NRK F7]|uniref:DUF2059 domain-containing protein n=1 Tax=Flavobacterium sp. NRK F7 TaxID=2954930 RepID=UPI0020914010|nr:DUF2059 domain-containing protein [Flavobacterium sp. NRK F7]MCO6161242.1 DUF2059 domain-containing protein [Flavobacterium sp. NRK F7]
MKKILVTLVVVLAAQFASAQDAFKADVLKVLKASGSAAQMEIAKEQVMNNIPESKRAEFSKDFDASLPALYDKMAKVYMEVYTHNDIKKMLEFYNSPVGKKIAEKASELTKKNMAASQEWGMELQGMMMKYMQ